MPPTLDANLQEILEEYLKLYCPDVKPAARAISMIMLEDGKTLDMLGAYYNLNRYFKLQEKAGHHDRELGLENLVGVIKKRNPGKYDKLNSQICTAMYRLSCDFSCQKQHPNSCRGSKWRAVGDAVFDRSCWDLNNEDEKEAVTTYRQMVKDAGLVTAESTSQSDT